MSTGRYIYFIFIHIFLKLVVISAFVIRKFTRTLYWFCLNYLNYNSRFLLYIIINIISQVKNIEKFYIKQFVKMTGKQWKKYKNLYKDKEVVVVGCGPTVNNYKMINDAIHIGVNRAFKIPHISLDYLCYQDAFPEGFAELEAYKRECVRLCGIFFPSRICEIKKSNIENPYYSKIFFQDKLFFILNPFESDYNYALDLETDAFCDAEGSIFSVLQFIMYTNPKRVYLVGCDCSDITSEFSFKTISPRYSRTKIAYIKFKEFAEKYYPDTELVSVNPVGLKGIFKDIYTQSYFDSNSELNLADENVEIIQG